MQEFVRILQLHEQYAAPLMQAAIEQALVYGCVHLDGVLYCLHQLEQQPPRASEEPMAKALEEVAPSTRDAIATQRVDLSQYEQLLKLSW